MAISFQCTKKKLMGEQADLYALFVPEDFKPAQVEVFTKIFSALPAMITAQRFTGKRGTFLSVPYSADDTLRNLMLLGLGKPTNKKCDIEAYRRACGAMVRHAQALRCAKLAVALPEAALFGVTSQYLAQQTAVIGAMAAYSFNTFKSSDDNNRDISVALVLDDHDAKKVERGLNDGLMIGSAVNDARELVNLPANVFRPDDFAAQAKQMAKEYGLQCTVFNAEKIKELGMGGLVAVGQGSAHEYRFVLLQYVTKNKKAPTLAFVGKGVTYDSGGLSLKPSDGMLTMKGDMAGAAAVLAAMKAIAHIKPAVNIVAAIPLAENMPSGTASKPDDIVRMYNGKTVEIRNTDAEGRLVLGDALAYTVKNYKPDFMIDVATLTGACERALGPYFSGMFTRQEDLAERVSGAADRSGDAVWRLPLTIDYQDTMNGTISDLMNTSTLKGKAGATTAAVFLSHFVDQTPWVHLDIAGTSIDIPAISYQRADEATGVGVRLLIELARSW